MRVEIRNDSIEIEGYVNAVERYSRPLPSVRGKFIEKIESKTFQRALEKTDNVDLLLNHDKERKLGSIKEGNLTLYEDNVGLRAICTITDPEVIEKAKKNELRGWSFGFRNPVDSWEELNTGISKRTIKDLELTEVSIIDNTKTPAYIATSIESRDNELESNELRTLNNEVRVVDNSERETKEEKREGKIDLSIYKNEIEIIKLKA